MGSLESAACPCGLTCGDAPVPHAYRGGGGGTVRAIHPKTTATPPTPRHLAPMSLPLANPHAAALPRERARPPGLSILAFLTAQQQMPLVAVDDASPASTQLSYTSYALTPGGGAPVSAPSATSPSYSPLPSDGRVWR